MNRQCNTWTLAEWENYYIILHNWNTCHSIKNFIQFYCKNFFYFTLKENPIWRVFRIIKYTHNGRYLETEQIVIDKIKELKEKEM